MEIHPFFNFISLNSRQFFLSILLLIFCTVNETHAQAKKNKTRSLSNDITQLSKERQEIERTVSVLEKQIRDFEKQLSGADSEEKTTLQALESLESQIKLHKEIIKQTEKSQKKLFEQISKTKHELMQVKRDLEHMKLAYARYAVGIYKFGVQRDMEVLFSSGSFNQAIIRASFIKRFEDAGRLKIQEITDKKNHINDLQEELDQRYSENEKLLEQRLYQAKVMEGRRAEREKLIAKLRQDKRRLQSQIARNQERAKSLQDAIQKMLFAEEDAIKRAREGKAKQYETHSEIPSETTVPFSEIKGEFEKSRGKLPWPVQSGVIVKTFGESENKDLKIVTFNNGVDISAPSGTPVFSVAEGLVSQIGFLPTFGNIVIVRHSSSYLTVYANLSEVKVVRGEKVTSGQTLGSTGKSTQGGGLVHFEVWHGKNKYDPELWLAEK